MLCWVLKPLTSQIMASSAANDPILNSPEIGYVMVNSGPVSCVDGTGLNNMTKEVTFDVNGTAKDILDNADQLGEAQNVTATTGGAALNVDQAIVIQALPCYQGNSSSYSIDDTASNIISATDAVLTKWKY